VTEPKDFHRSHPFQFQVSFIFFPVPIFFDYSSKSSRSQSFDLGCTNGMLSKCRNPICRQPRRPLFPVLVCYLDLGLGNMQSVLISPMHQRHTAYWKDIKHSSFCKHCTAQDKTSKMQKGILKFVFYLFSILLTVMVHSIVISLQSPRPKDT
jgi:hypothetical protein